MATAALLVLLGATGLFLAGVATYLQGRARNDALIGRGDLGRVESALPSRMDRFDRALRRTRVGHHLGLRLAAAGVSLSVGQLVVLAAAVVLGGYLVVGAIFGHVVGLLVGAALVGVGILLVKRRRDLRAELFIAQLPELARVLSNAASAGLALRTGIAMAAGTLAEPAASEMRDTADALAMGRSVDEALDDLRRRLPSRELGVLVTTLIIQHRSGGALVSALKNLSETLDARKDVRREVRTLMAGSVFTGYLVAIIGVATLVLLDVIDPGTVNKMFSNPAGLAAVAVAAGFYLVGFVLIRRITRTPN